MEVYLFHNRPEGVVLVSASGEQPGELIADMEFRIGPGENFAGVTYEQLVALGDGKHTLPEPR